MASSEASKPDVLYGGPEYPARVKPDLLKSTNKQLLDNAAAELRQAAADRSADEMAIIADDEPVSMLWASVGSAVPVLSTVTTPAAQDLHTSIVQTTTA